MRMFQSRELTEALACAAGGGQALHLHRFVASRAPRCFRDAVARGEDVAHLFDADAARLRRTARALGVRVIVVEREGTAKQHLDLCGEPLRRALDEVEP